MFIFLLFSFSQGLLTSEILSSFTELKNISILVEITNINLDVPKSSYTWNTFLDSDILYKNIKIRYRYTNISYFSNESYWSLWNFAQNSKNFSFIPIIYHSSYNIFLFHSENYLLIHPFYFYPSELCQSSNITYLTNDKTISIYINPLENLSINTIHSLFIQE